MVPDIAFDLRLEQGRCVGVRIPEAEGTLAGLAESALAPEERAFAATLGAARKRTWIGGRVALRQALAVEGIDALPILSDARGAPMMPAGVAASVSHKDRLAVALVARETRARVGVDAELDAPRSRDVSARVLADDEERELAILDAKARARAVLLRFSMKEAIYKAIDPFVRRYVAFKEVSVFPRDDGSAEVRARLGEGRFAIDVRWRRSEGLVLTTARVEPHP